MEVKTVLALTVFSVVISIGLSLNCYVCAGTNASDCAKARKAAMSIEDCGNFSSSLFSYSDLLKQEHECNNEVDEGCILQSVCLRLNISQNSRLQPGLLVRQCGLFPKIIDPCQLLEKVMHIDGCKYCKTNLCNVGVSQPTNTTL